MLPSIVVPLLLMALAMPVSGAAADYCFEEAGVYYDINPQILWALSKNESNHRNDAVNKNDNGTIDVCHMQINSIWRKEIGEAAWAGLKDPCYCTYVGAWVLAGCIGQYGYSWDAIGCYHSRTESRRQRYAGRIAATLRKIAFSTPEPTACTEGGRTCGYPGATNDDAEGAAVIYRP